MPEPRHVHVVVWQSTGEDYLLSGSIQPLDRIGTVPDAEKFIRELAAFCDHRITPKEPSKCDCGMSLRGQCRAYCFGCPEKGGAVEEMKEMT
jgi:hypothetical protein